MARILVNERGLERSDAPPAAAGRRADADPERVLAFHRTLPGYAPTPLRSCPDLAHELGVAEVWLKDETSRLGLPAFKILGASWAAASTLWERLGLAPEEASERGAVPELETIRSALAEREQAGEPPVELVTATDGNHGRAVARVARWLGCPATVFMPAGTVPARVEAIAAEGARVEVLEDGYDDSVRHAAAHAHRAGAGALLVQDTSWPGYEAIPARVIEGYSTLIGEVRAALDAQGRPMPGLAVVPIGVGSLAAAVAAHPCAPGRLIGVEAEAAACALESAAAGASRTAAGSGETIMAGLNCGTLATLAWPAIRDRYGVLVAVDDHRAAEGMRRLAREGIVAGESGAASLAGLLELAGASGPDAERARRRIGLGPQSHVLLLVTEGPTDPDGYARHVG